PGLFFLHLDGDFDLIAGRVARREGHFMPPSLLRSQFDALEPLGADERGAVVGVEGDAGEVTDRALAALPAPSGS
ncbi:gluconokinase, partial [Streptomyces sp. NPDC059506]